MTSNKNNWNKRMQDFVESNSPEKQFGNEMFDKTMKYQKKYGFKTDINPKEATHNNESDAFKHMFMQAVLSIRYGDVASNMLGNKHERDGRKAKQDPREENMDLWNNAIGRKIAKEVKQEIKANGKHYSQEQVEDRIAEKIMQRITRGEAITDLTDQRKFDT